MILYIIIRELLQLVYSDFFFIIVYSDLILIIYV